jgi:hypothetical protein
MMNTNLNEIMDLTSKYRWTIYLIVISFALLFFSFIPVPNDEIPVQFYAYMSGLCSYGAFEAYLDAKHKMA